MIEVVDGYSYIDITVAQVSRAVREAFNAIDSDSMYRYFRVSTFNVGAACSSFQVFKECLQHV